MDSNETDLKWFAIRVTYSREMALKGYLDQCGIESFIPMHYKEFIKRERKVRKLVPVIHNLVFVRLNREKMDEIKKDISLKIPVRYIMNKEKHEPLVVPDRQMHSFIAVAGAGGLSRFQCTLVARGRPGAHYRWGLCRSRGGIPPHQGRPSGRRLHRGCDGRSHGICSPLSD